MSQKMKLSREEKIKLTQEFLWENLKKAINYPDAKKRDIEYRYEHSCRVAYIGEQIAKNEHLDEERMIIACLLHDVGYAIDYKTMEESMNHGRDGAKIARPFLKKLGYTQDEINEMCYGIATHVDDKADFEFEANIFTKSIGDADNIDRFDAFRLFEGLANNDYKNMNLEEQKKFVFTKLPKFERAKGMEFTTPTAQKMWEEKMDFHIAFYNKLKHQIETSNFYDFKYELEDVIIRKEEKDDERIVEDMVRESFYNVYRPGAIEHYLLYKMRNDDSFVKDLDLVLVKDDLIIGHVAMCKSVVMTEKEKIDTLTLGPIAIRNEYKKKGYGQKLLSNVLEKAKELGYGAVLLEGNIDFYGTCGFEYAKNLNVYLDGLNENEDSSFFLCKELKQNYLRNKLKNTKGIYKDPAIYLVQEDMDFYRYDKTFPYLEKKELKGQLTNLSKLETTELRKTRIDEINKLVELSIASFNSDVLVGGLENDGPPDYDSYLWHEKMCKEGRLYTYIVQGRIMGGAVLFEYNNEVYIGRIFIDPSYFKKGYGLKLMKEIEKLYPTATKYKLDTPLWNMRTNNFYKKCGYKMTKSEDDTVTYEKMNGCY